MTLTIPLLALLALLPAQDGAPQPVAGPPRPNDGWKELDRVVVIVNEDIFAQRALQKDLLRIKNKQGLEGKNALQQAQNEVLTQRVREKLWVQAGQDMGVDAAQVQRLVKNQLEGLEERYDGVVGLSEYLQSRDLDSNSAREQLEQDLYSDLYDRYITGSGPTALGRISRDTYVRPGLLRFHYNTVLANRQGLAQISGQPQTVVLQFLILDPQQFDDLEKAHELAQQLRQRIVDGEDMGQLNDRYGGAKRNQGLTEPFDEARVAQVDAAIGEFLRDARPGDVSEVMEYRTGDRSTWRIVRLVDRTPAQIPEFESVKVQKSLLRTIEDVRREYRREEAFKRLIKGSYIWPSELTGG